MTHWSEADFQANQDKLARKGIIIHEPEKKNKAITVQHVQSVNNVCKINIKPLSVNHGYTGKRWKTPAHRIWHKAVMRSLPNIEMPEPPYQLYLKFGFERESSDGDNCIKFITDCLAKKYNFNDKKIKRWIIDVEKVNKNEEYFSFQITNLNKQIGIYQ